MFRPFFKQMNLNDDTKRNPSTKKSPSSSELEVVYIELYWCDVRGENNWN